jgi:hypothetical protein
LQKQFSPSTQFVGADVMPSFLPKDDPHVRYVIQDVGKPFADDLQGAFDFTHLRYVLAGAAQHGIENSIKNLASSLAPGGWLQIMELDLDYDAPVLSPAARDVLILIRTLVNGIGVRGNWINEFEPAFSNVGLVNVSSYKVELKTGKLLGNEADSKLSIEPNKITIPSLIQACESK